MLQVSNPILTVFELMVKHMTFFWATGGKTTSADAFTYEVAESLLWAPPTYSKYHLQWYLNRVAG